jgi:hypothetical protein
MANYSKIKNPIKTECSDKEYSVSVGLELELMGNSYTNFKFSFTGSGIINQLNMVLSEKECKELANRILENYKDDK